jgi:hypothetical protein
VCGQHHGLAAFTPGKDPVPIVKETGWASENKGKDHVETHLVVALVILFIAFVLIKYGSSFKYINSHRGRGQTLKHNNTTIINFLLK